MARPPRPSSLTTKVTFRLHPDEAKRLDELVKTYGLKDRSALLRAWLLHLDPTPQIANAGSTPREEVNTTKIPVDAKNNADETATTPSNSRDEASQRAEFAKALSATRQLVALAIHREADERSGWSRIPNAVRVLLPLMTPTQFLLVTEVLQGAGMLELSPPNGRYERVRMEDVALCPRDSRGKVLSRARLTGKGLALIAGILPPNPQ